MQYDKWSIQSLKGNSNHTSFLLLGGNLGDTQKYFAQCIDLILKNGIVIEKQSAIYRSEPWGMKNAAWFLNQVLQINTTLTPEILLNVLLAIETSLGRVRDVSTNEVYQSRSLDIDILYYDQLILETKSLTVPHPRLHLRRFTLLPMVELAPYWMHPVLGLNQGDLLNKCEDEGITHRDG